MKLLFENWRKFVNEADDDIRSQAGLAALQGDQEHSSEDVTTILKKAQELINKYSLHTGNVADDRWERGMPAVDYDFNADGEDRFLFHATLTVIPEEEEIAERDLQGEHELERRLIAILNELGIGMKQGLDNINFYDSKYGQAEIHIRYAGLPDEAWDLRGFESFLKRIRDISNKFEKFRIIDQLYKQGQLDL
tara:strand:+ start:124 stop:702 length:579 start_codon:yes stop_codon:yes gene_type:complete